MNTQEKTIFLVDDDIDDQEFFIEAITQIKYARLYDVASNGKEALARLQQARVLPNLICMDINMPLMNGIECLLKIIADPIIGNIPVVIISSSSEDTKKVIALGAKGFIEKTSDAIALRNGIEEALQTK